ncbi:hypothetical protein GBA65_13470 [Rubrobacter marinus]|uniref:Uncharacterized protein n=1 Tax=Rubrobacter marinus TaxID=2653852 RepID=A0A6G8PYM9_9ACTN|nr:hypothetical protein [Rubrobacter marinus]QIN79354.1 hypothetical protein GBA65_13470 [Rubrobacter marinus]
MPEVLSQLLAEPATALVRESFAGVEAEWWWERRLDGGIVVCQEFDPMASIRAVAEETGRPVPEVERIALGELGLEDPEPVVLTFELPGATETRDAARALVERSRAPQGLAASLYRRLEEAVREGQGRPRGDAPGPSGADGR